VGHETKRVALEIGEALRVARPEATISVGPGLYHENLTTTKIVTIAAAEARGSVRIEGGA
jgi:hypothetical protein